MDKSPESVLDNLIHSFNIDTEIKSTAKKYLLHDEKWEILKNFTTVTPFIGVLNKTVDDRRFQIIFDFDSAENASTFSNNFGVGIPKFIRHHLKNNDKNPKEFLISLDTEIVLDSEKSPKVVIIKLI